MITAHVGVETKSISCELTEPQTVITECLVNFQHTSFKCRMFHVFLNIVARQKIGNHCTCIASANIIARLELAHKHDYRVVHCLPQTFQHICTFGFGDNGPAHRVVDITKGIHAKTIQSNGATANIKSGISVQLKQPTCLDVA